MNVLCIYPGMDKRVNENAYMLTRLHEKGANVAIISGRSMGLKGEGDLPPYEFMDGIPIHRLYKDLQEMFLSPKKSLNQVLDVASNLNPDVIFCSQELNMRLALLIQNSVKKPIVLLVEDAGVIASGKAYQSIKMRLALHYFGIPRAPELWSWLCQKADAVITCNPQDKPHINTLSKFNKPLFYLPWPSYLPPDLELGQNKEPYQGIYIGSLYPFKNIKEFQTTIPLILDHTPTKRFIVVGTGPEVEKVKNLQKNYGGRLMYIEHLTRNESLKLISNSYFAYTPVEIGKGWGFIGDCWSVRTPILMTHNDIYVKNGENALLSSNFTDFVENIKKLYTDNEMYARLQTNGYKEYDRRKASTIGDSLYEILSSVSKGIPVHKAITQYNVEK